MAGELKKRGNTARRKATKEPKGFMSMQVTQAEYDRICDGAERVHETYSGFVRNAALKRADEVLGANYD